MRSWLLGASLLAGCPGPTNTHVAIRAYVEPVDPAASVVIRYHPWSVDSAGVAKAGPGAALADPLEGVQLTCTNSICDTRPGSATITKPPAGGAPIAITVSKEGFEPVQLAVPPKLGSHTYLVVMRPLRGAP